MASSEDLAKEKQRVVDTARAMLDGTINYFQGAERLLEARDTIGVYANDPHFFAFTAVLSAADFLRGEQGAFDWSKLSDVSVEAELSSATQWARALTVDHCHALIKRYSNESG